MLTEEDISRVLEETVESGWYGIKEDRVYWTSSLCRLANDKGYEYEELYMVMDDACTELAKKGGSTFRPYLSAFKAYIRDGKVNEKGGKPAYQEYFDSLPDCEYCLDGKRHALLWDTPEHADIYYFQCNCKKGQAMHAPIYVDAFEAIEKMRDEYGDRFYCGKTRLYTGEPIKPPVFRDTYDPELGAEVPF